MGGHYTENLVLLGDPAFKGPRKTQKAAGRARGGGENSLEPATRRQVTSTGEHNLTRRKGRGAAVEVGGRALGVALPTSVQK